MTVLLLWNEVPEKLSCVRLDNLTTEEMAVLQAANGSYVNSEITEEADAAALKINAAMMPAKYEYSLDEETRPWCGRWIDYVIPDKDLPSAGPFDQVFVAGFIC